MAMWRGTEATSGMVCVELRNKAASCG